MFTCTIPVPEPFHTALECATPASVCDAEASTPEALFGRAQARLMVGRESEARHDLESAFPALGDICRIELDFLDVREEKALKKALASARDVAARAAPKSSLAARAWHVVGLAEEKLRHTPAAVDALLRAVEIYSTLNNCLAQAQVLDTLGTVEAARGRFDYALSFYALSLVDKTMLGDRPGMAITLGNLGRVHLLAGRFRQAVQCFERDLRLAVEMGDDRGQARMHEDLGRAWLGIEDFPTAEENLRRCLEIAEHCDFRDLQFFARKDLAVLRTAQGRLDEAGSEIVAAEKVLPCDADPYFHCVLGAARGDLLLARDDPVAVDVLAAAVKGFEEAEMPDFEIAARISLAKAYAKRRYKALAEDCLLRGLRIARSEGYSRYLPVLNEAMTALQLVEGAIDESNRSISAVPSTSTTSYVILKQLGTGAFGDVFRVYDPERGKEVALKRLRLGELYDVNLRRRILASARMELEAASRVRHPGVVRVLAIGTEPDGASYVVQELVQGRPLRDLFPKDATADPYHVLPQLARIAHALQALHDAGVIHRDLKPENILIREDGYPVLIDFGIAHIAGTRGEVSQLLTGTLPYMAPEQAMGRKATAQTDLYALGVTAYEWLTGVKPLRPRGGSMEEVVRDIATRPPTPMSDFRRDIAPELERFIMSMLEKKPGRRPANAISVATKCEGLAHSTLLKDSAPQGPRRDAAPTRIIKREP